MKNIRKHQLVFKDKLRQKAMYWLLNRCEKLIKDLKVDDVTLSSSKCCKSLKSRSRKRISL